MYDLLIWPTYNHIFVLVIWYILWFTPFYTNNIITFQPMTDLPFFFLLPNLVYIWPRILHYIIDNKSLASSDVEGWPT